MTPEDLLALIQRATAPLTGGDYFRLLVKELARSLGVKVALITECLDYPRNHVRTLAYWERNDYAEDIEFDLVGTPCEDVIHGGQFCFYPSGMDTLFPEWSEHEGGVTSFIGIPIHAPDDGRVIGHIAVYNDRTLRNELVVESIFRVIAARAGAELLRIQAEAALRNSEEKYRLLVENQTDLIVKLDEEGRMNFVSPSYCQLMGLVEDRALGMEFPPLLSGDRDDVARAWKELRDGTGRAELSRKADTVRGRRRIAWNIKVVSNEGATSAVSEYVASGRDVTDQERAEERAREHLARLAHVSRLVSMGEMASALAHEVNQPLTAILTNVQGSLRLLRRSEPDLDAIRQGLERAQGNAGHARDVVAKLRGYVKRAQTTLEPLEVPDLIDELVSLMHHDLRDRQVALGADFAPRIPPILADRVQMNQVLINLIRNGLDAIDQSGNGERCISILARDEAPGFVTFTVKDSGGGVDEGLRDRLFDAFTTGKAEGMGIGLSLCRSLVEEHGGRIWLAGTGPRGTAFSFNIPKAREATVAGGAVVTAGSAEDAY